MKELVICSGKGGTGKTSVVASFAALADDPVLADCDVDAANLHLVLTPVVDRRFEFSAGHVAKIVPSRCIGCDICVGVCQYGAIAVPAEVGEPYTVDPLRCEGCGVCVHFCPERAIEFPERKVGEWIIAETRHGPLVTARLRPGAENSGKLVTKVRSGARVVAQARHNPTLLVDAPPGIGCPVIASLTDADAALVVTEPTPSGMHDLERIVELIRSFDLDTFVVTNKYDLNDEMSDRIADYCAGEEIPLVGRIPFDPLVTSAQLACTSVVELDDSPAAQALRAIWERIDGLLIH